MGGGNSAGQAAIFLAGTVEKVIIATRGGDLGKSMSRYLVDRIVQTANIEVRTHTTVIGLSGDRALESVRLRDSRTGAETSVPGVFAVGDVRSESVKRVASAVGEGSMAVRFVHEVLARG